MSCTPRFSITRWPRDGKIHAPRALDALEAWPRKLTSYLMLYGDGNNHRYDGAKKHRGVTPLLSVHLAHTHSHLPVSLDTKLLRSNLNPFASMPSSASLTSPPATPKANSHSITPEQTFFAWNQEISCPRPSFLGTPLHPQAPRPRVRRVFERTSRLCKSGGQAVAPSWRMGKSRT